MSSSTRTITVCCSFMGHLSSHAITALGGSPRDPAGRSAGASAGLRWFYAAPMTHYEVLGVSRTASATQVRRAYLDLAKQYSVGQQPKLETARMDRIRELMRSRKGMFRFHAISEVVLTQGPDGKVLTIEIPLSSGHPGIDEGAKDAITTAVSAMVDPPSVRVHHGRSFTSTWRMRATWTMVPPTAFLTGAGFDITAKGFTIDVPFDITLKTFVGLLRTDAHAHSSSSDDAEP